MLGYDACVPALLDSEGFWHRPLECVCENCLYRCYIEGAEADGTFYCKMRNVVVAVDDVCGVFELNTHVIDDEVYDESMEYLESHSSIVEVEYVDDGVVRLLD